MRFVNRHRCLIINYTKLIIIGKLNFPKLVEGDMEADEAAIAPQRQSLSLWPQMKLLTCINLPTMTLRVT